MSSSGKDLTPRADVCSNVCRQYFELYSEVASLKQKLAERDVIERAKWAIVAKKNMSEEEAHDFLMKSSRKTRLKLVKIAELVLTGKTVG
ncbi:MAG: ANTAR domain-containing protein [Deltaproteobacteria bacterium]|nr:ANTAR domain-containing protein [Deltaproteobacteria bacterium]